MMTCLGDELQAQPQGLGLGGELLQLVPGYPGVLAQQQGAVNWEI